MESIIQILFRKMLVVQEATWVRCQPMRELLSPNSLGPAL